MSETKTATVDTATGLFCEDGRVTHTTIVVTVPDNPDVLRHRYSGDPKNPIRKATAREIAAAQSEESDAKAEAEITKNRVAQALVLAVAELTGKTPTQVMTVVKDKYQSLNMTPV